MTRVALTGAKKLLWTDEPVAERRGICRSVTTKQDFSSKLFNAMHQKGAQIMKTSRLVIMTAVLSLFAGSTIAQMPPTGVGRPMPQTPLVSQTPSVGAENPMTTEPRIAGPGPRPFPWGVPCPDPITHTETVSAPSPAVVDPSQLPPSFVSPPNAEPNFGGTMPNRLFRHTFQFKLPNRKCCQCTDVTLTLKLKALKPGTNHQSSDAGNDTWYIFKNGKHCGTPANANFVYDMPPSFNAGHAVTKTIKVPCGCLAVSGNTAKLTFAVQDDTSVEAATLNVRGCCLKKPLRGKEMESPDDHSPL